MARFTVEFSDKAAESLERLSKEEETTKVEILRRALTLYEFFRNETRKGERVLLADKDGEKVLKQVVLT